MDKNDSLPQCIMETTQKWRSDRQTLEISKINELETFACLNFDFLLPPQWQHCMQKEQKSVLLTPFSLSFFQNYKSDKFTIQKALSKMMILIVSYRSHFWDKDDIFLWKCVTFKFLLSAAFTATSAVT